MSGAEATEEPAEEPVEGEPEIGDLSAIIEKSRLQQVIDQLTVTVSEGILRIGHDGLGVSVVDPANVTMTDIQLTESAFESVGKGKFPIGINFQKLSNHLGYANSGELIQLSYKAETRMLNVHYGGTDVDIASIDPDTIRDEPDTPSLNHTASATLGAGEFKQAVSHCGKVTDHVQLTADADAGELRIYGDGDTDDVTHSFGRDDLVDGRFEEDTIGLYSIGYLTGDNGVATQFPKDAELTLSYASENPLVMEYEFADGHGTATVTTAPRIQRA